jgi:DNA-binding response OmpR family regulator
MLRPEGSTPGHAAARPGPILVLSASPWLRNVVRWVLEGEGLAVEVVTTVHEGLARVTSRPPALVMMIFEADWPAVDREGVVAEIPLACGDRTRLLVVDRADRPTARLRRDGARDYLPRPFTAASVVAEVGRILAAAHPGKRDRSAG